MDVTPGAVVDYSFLEQWIMDFINENELNVILFCYDPYGATQFSQNMANHGLTVVEVRQGFPTLSEPTKEFRDYVYQNNQNEKKITHVGDKVLSWAVGNAIAEMAANESIKLSKSKSRERIDPIAAIITAYVQARFATVNSGEGNIKFISVNDL
jgi:phage terminase large subunit-like protein